MKFDIKHQDSYSRVELLLRNFFGFIYIGIPHGIWGLILNFVSSIVNLIAFFAVLITGKYPKGLFEFQVKYFRYTTRVSAVNSNLVDGYPSFSLDAISDKVTLEVPYPERLSRLHLLAKVLFGFFYVFIPHGVILLFRWIIGMAFSFIAWWAVLITGKYPEGMHKFIVANSRWGMRVNLYMSYMTDEYPPFTGEER